MGWTTVLFIIVGAVGLGLLALSMLGGELFDFDGADSVLSIEVVAAVLAGFGFTAAFISALPGVDLPLALVAALGAIAAVPVAYLAWLLTGRARNMPTDATPNRTDLVGRPGVVVTEIRAGGYGEVRVRIGGQQVKLNALADEPLPAGVHVLVVEAPSDTSVKVRLADPERN
ncbi:membrane protein implicated in regulation of membrane protease activity [Hamadaea flava]|uniref:NfeD family protein n=1 Tax=Hamadaea flava TaxID=1742688 RepID=A0ABV8LGM2_9ACTN|nr:NfeD family protein [Hamadaea flava]MCP2326098.1 membrane protein implicated in regulation of membrane protease activity [Hamadaea flava]